MDFPLKIFSQLAVILVAMHLNLLPVASAIPDDETLKIGVSEALRLVREKFSEEQYFFVGVGRSPTPLITALQIQKPGSAMNLPFTAMGRTRNWEDYEEWSFEHFDRFIPYQSQLNGKRLLLIDYAQEGGSVKRIEHQLQRFLAVYRPGVVAETLVFADSPMPHSPPSTNVKGSIDGLRPFHVIALRDHHPALKRVMYGSFKEYAEYLEYEVGTKGFAKPNPAFEELAAKLQRVLAAPLKTCTAAIQ